MAAFLSGGEGKSTLAIGLAISASRIDKRVLLIDADLRNPRLHDIFNLNNEHGLATLLEGGLGEEEMLSIPQWVYMRWDNEAAKDFSNKQPGLRRIRTPLSDLNIDVITANVCIVVYLNVKARFSSLQIRGKEQLYSA